MVKRIVLQYTSGPYRDLWQIVGTENQLPTLPHTSALPPFLDNVTFLDQRQGACSLVRVKPRYVLYREVIAPEALRAFNPEQR